MLGETDRVLDATGVDAPMPLSILNEFAFVVVQVSNDEEPIFIVEGDAASVQAGAGGGGVGVTVMVVAHVAEPPAPVTVPL